MLNSQNIMQQHNKTLIDRQMANRLLTILSICIVIISITIINITSIFSLLFYLVILHLLNKFILKENLRELYQVFFIYSIAMLVIYICQYFSFPLTMGLTSGRGTGADDVFFYSQSAIDFPLGFPFDVFMFNPLEPYSVILNVFSNIFHVFYDNHPLDLLFLNVLITTLVPFYTRKIASVFISNAKVLNSSFVLVIVCPFIITNGLILLRDVLTTLLFLMVLYYFIKERFFLCFSMLAFLFYIRTGSALLTLIIFPCSIIASKEKLKLNNILMAFIIIPLASLFVIISLPELQYYLSSKGLGNGLLRNDFVSTIENMTVEGDSSTYVKIASLPLLIRIPLSALFYFSTPIIGSVQVVVNGIFQPRNVLMNYVYPLIFIFLLPSFINGVYLSYKNNKYFFKSIVILYFILLVGLSLSSMQIRHKTLIMPLFYIISSYGMAQKSSVFNIGVLLTFIFFMAEILYNLLF